MRNQEKIETSASTARRRIYNPIQKDRRAGR